MEPISEFRMFPVHLSEPVDRTVSGTVVGEGTVLDLGNIDTTDEPGIIPVKALWWRITDMNGAIAVFDIKVWLSGTEALLGTNHWYMDITDAWTKGKTDVQVETGVPGNAPLSMPETNIMRMGGGEITGTTHEQTSQYIYLSGRIGINEPIGINSDVTLTISYNYY